MTVTPKPTITVRVSGPVGSGKSYVLTRIKEMVKRNLEKASLSMPQLWTTSVSVGRMSCFRSNS